MTIGSSRLASTCVLALATACSGVTEVTMDDLVPVLERDAVAFAGTAVPDAVLSRLATHRVVLLGEVHHLREHYEFVAALLAALHDRGYRQLLIEWPHMADWLINDWVNGGKPIPGWEPPEPLGRAMLAAIRDFNDSLPAGDRIEVRAIDVNLDDYGGAASFRDLLGTVAGLLPSAGPLTTFLAADYGASATQGQAIRALQQSLAADASALTAAWGAAWYATIVEMAEVELVSIDVRARRQSDYDRSVRTREDMMKELADRRIAQSAYRTVINVGNTHAQKERLFGTDIEWLGEHLARRSDAVGGSIFVVGTTAAVIELEPGAAGTPYDVRDASPENELFRNMADGWPARTVFLPLDDPLFSAGGVPLNVEGTVYVGAPKRQFDALLQYPLAHRVPRE